MTNITREQWLHKATEKLRPLFVKAGAEIPEHVQLSIGFPSKRALSARNQRVGECWSNRVSEDGIYHIFISPVLKNPVKVLGVLVHELVHAAVGTDAGHKAPFKKAALAVGLTGKMTATEETPELQEKLKNIIDKIGDYPHGALSAQALARVKKQSTRLLKVVCPEGCENDGNVYSARVTRVHLKDGKAPFCGMCNERMVDPNGEDETDDGERDDD